MTEEQLQNQLNNHLQNQLNNHLPLYRDISSRYGIVFTGDSKRPIIIDWHNCRIHEPVMRYGGYGSGAEVAEIDLDCFQLPGGNIYLNLDGYYFEIDTSFIQPKHGHETIKQERYYGLKRVYEEIQKRGEGVEIESRAVSSEKDKKSLSLTFSSTDKALIGSSFKLTEP